MLWIRFERITTGTVVLARSPEDVHLPLVLRSIDRLNQAHPDSSLGRCKPGPGFVVTCIGDTREAVATQRKD